MSYRPIVLKTTIRIGLKMPYNALALLQLPQSMKFAVMLKDSSVWNNNNLYTTRRRLGAFSFRNEMKGQSFPKRHGQYKLSKKHYWRSNAALSLDSNGLSPTCSISRNWLEPIIADLPMVQNWLDWFIDDLSCVPQRASPWYTMLLYKAGQEKSKTGKRKEKS